MLSRVKIDLGLLRSSQLVARTFAMTLWLYDVIDVLTYKVKCAMARTSTAFHRTYSYCWKICWTFVSVRQHHIREKLLTIGLSVKKIRCGKSQFRPISFKMHVKCLMHKMKSIRWPILSSVSIVHCPNLTICSITRVHSLSADETEWRRWPGQSLGIPGVNGSVYVSLYQQPVGTHIALYDAEQQKPPNMQQKKL